MIEITSTSANTEQFVEDIGFAFSDDIERLEEQMCVVCDGDYQQNDWQLFHLSNHGVFLAQRPECLKPIKFCFGGNYPLHDMSKQTAGIALSLFLLHCLSHNQCDGYVVDSKRFFLLFDNLISYTKEHTERELIFKLIKSLRCPCRW